jgi:hypothetical protein
LRLEHTTVVAEAYEQLPNGAEYLALVLSLHRNLRVAGVLATSTTGAAENPLPPRVIVIAPLAGYPVPTLTSAPWLMVRAVKAVGAPPVGRK